jgi:hypothetical protein
MSPHRRPARALAAAVLALLCACDPDDPSCSEEILLEMQETCLEAGGDFTGQTYGSAEGACSASSSSARCEGVQKGGCAIACVLPDGEGRAATDTATNGDGDPAGSPEGDTAAEGGGPSNGGSGDQATEYVSSTPFAAACSASRSARGAGVLGALLALSGAALRRSARRTPAHAPRATTT